MYTPAPLNLLSPEDTRVTDDMVKAMRLQAMRRFVHFVGVVFSVKTNQYGKPYLTWYLKVMTDVAAAAQYGLLEPHVWLDRYNVNRGIFA